MSKVNDAERRKIAQGLRDSWKQTWHGEKMMHRLRIALGIGHEVSAYGKFRYYRAVAEKLADLIEPEPERTCRDVGGNDKFVCSECSASLDYEGRWDEPTYWVDDVAAAVEYCPSCGARVVYDD